MAFKVNLSDADKKKVAELNKKQRQKYISGGNSSGLNNGIKLPERESLGSIGNAQVRNNALLGLDLFNRVNAFGEGSRETERRYKAIAASPEIQELAKGQSYLKKELPQSGLMLGGDPVARNAAMRTAIKANATEQEREVQAAKDLIAAANSPVERFMQGFGRGLAPGPTTRFSWQEETPTEKMVSDLTNNTVSGAAGNMVGEALPYLMAYGKLGGAVGDAAMKLPGAAKLGKFGQGALKSVAADAVLGAPLNANYVLNKQGLRGEEAAKEFAKQEALDFGLGVGMEFIGAAFKKLRGRNLTSEADLLNLTAAERAEVESYAERLQRLADESNVRKGKNQIDNRVIEGWTPETLANERGLLPPQKENPTFNPQRRGLASTKNFSAASNAYENAVDNLEEYIKNYKPKGTETNIVPIGEDMTGRGARMTVSRNDQWYQDFYREHGRAPRKSEARELAMKLIDDDLNRPYGEFHNPELSEIMNRNMDTIGQGRPRTVRSYVEENIERPYTVDSARAGREVPKTVMPGELKTLPAESIQQKVLPPIREKSIIEVKEVHTPKQVQTIKEYKASVDNDVFHFVEKVKNLKDKNVASKLNHSLGDVDKRAMRDIEKLTGVNVSGYKHNINGSAVNHIEERHGINGVADSTMRNSEDVARIKYILENYDDVELAIKPDGAPDSFSNYLNSDRTPSKGIKFSKSVNGTYYVVEAVPDSNSKRLQIVSAYMENKKKSTANAEHVLHNTVPQPTSETPYASTLNDSILPLPQKNVKKDLGADTNHYPPRPQVSKVKLNTFDNSKMFKGAEKEINTADFTYNPISEKQSIEEAKMRLAADLEGEKADLARKADYDGVDLDTAMGILEQEKLTALKTGDYSEVRKWAKLIQEKGTQSGQMIQAFAKYTRTPEGAVIKAEKTINSVLKDIEKKNPNLLKKVESDIEDILIKYQNGEINLIKGSDEFLKKLRGLADEGNVTRENIEALVKEKYDIPTLNDEDVKKITEYMTKGEAASGYEREMWFSKAEQLIADKVPAEFREKFRAMQRLSLILNPKTLITRNPLGNVALGLAENVKDIPASALDRLLSLKTGARTTEGLNLNKIIDQAGGIKQGTTEWWKDIKNGVDTSPSRGRYELPNKRIFKNKALNALDQFERQALQLGDRPFYQAAYNSRYNELLRLGRNADEAEMGARLFALDRVFQNNSKLAQSANKIRNALNDMTGIPLGDLVMPFTQTPANIFDKVLEYMPVINIGKMAKAAHGFKKGTVGQKELVDIFGRAFTGTGLAVLGYAMAANGMLTGNLYGSDKKLYKAQSEAGVKSYAIKIGDSYYTYDWASPIGTILAAAADAQRAAVDKEDFLDSIGAGLEGGIDTIFNQSFLSGVFDMLSGYSPTAGIAKALMGSTSQLTPTATANVAKTIDPYVRETYDPNKLKEQGNKLKARVPFLSKTLPIKLDTAGQPMKQNQGRSLGERAVENFIAPWTKGTETDDKVRKELLDLQGKTGESEVLFEQVPREISNDGQKFQLTPQEYRKYQETMGKKAYGDVKKLIESEAYKDMSDREKAKAIKGINEEAKELAKAEVLVSRGESPEDVYLTTDKMKDAYKRFGGKVSAKKTREIYKSFEGEYRRAWGSDDNESPDISNGKAAVLLASNNADDTMRIALDISRDQDDAAKNLVSKGWTIDDIKECEGFCKSIHIDGQKDGKVSQKKILAYLREYYPRHATVSMAQEINKII